MATYTTKQQKAVLDCLSERADSPVSAAAIVDALREQGEHVIYNIGTFARNGNSVLRAL